MLSTHRVTGLILLIFTLAGVVLAQQQSADRPIAVPGNPEDGQLRQQSTQVANLKPQPSETTFRWTIAFELAFGEDSPYSKEFPDLYELPYDVNLAITREVLDQIVALAIKETDAKQIALNYRPGGYKDFPVVPSAQLELVANEQAARDVMNIVGYLAQQTLVIGSHVSKAGNRNALLIREKSTSNLANVKTVEQFWHRLAEFSPKLQPGFSSVELNARPGLYIIDADGDWLAQDLPKFQLVIGRLSKEFNIDTNVTIFSVAYFEHGNNWRLDSRGEQYLRYFQKRALGDLSRRLEFEYQERVRTFMRRAFEEHASAVLQQFQKEKKKTHPPGIRLNSPSVPIAKQSRPEYMQNP